MTAVRAYRPRATAAPRRREDRRVRSLGSESEPLTGAIDRIVDVGPTLGRTHVDVIHGSRIHKLKEARIDRGTRVVFAFDSNQNAVMLAGRQTTRAA